MVNSLLENGYITELTCGSNFSYILSDNSAFLSTEYKVLQSQSNRCFVKCMKMLYNGKVQLYYVTNSLKPFASMLPTLDSDSFLTITANLLSNIIDVKQNGFLSCQNIDISFEHIYVDQTTYKVCLVYLPVNKRIYDDISTFENEIRTGFVKLISGISTLSSQKTMQFSSDLSNGTLTMEDLYSRIKGGKAHNSESVFPIEDGNNKALNSVRIIAMNSPIRVELKVTKDSFLIGRNASSVDGVVSFNKMIGRIHCRINRHDGQYTITDLQSANGTYVNRVRLKPNQPCSIKNGDIIRLANSDFQVNIV